MLLIIRVFINPGLSKLWPIASFYIAHTLRIIFIFLNGKKMKEEYFMTPEHYMKFKFWFLSSYRN